MNFSDLFDKLPGFGTAGVSLFFLLCIYIMYKAYKKELPVLDIDLSIIDKDAYKNIIKQLQSEEVVPQLDHDLYLKVQIVNTGKRMVCPVRICNDGNRQITALMKDKGLGSFLKEGGKYFDVHPLNENSIKMLRISRSIYVEDFAGKKFSVPKEQLKNILLVINNNKK